MLLHIEGLVVLIVCLYFYGANEFNWWMFLVLILAPDISMLGYLINKKVGAIIYNLFHTYIIPLCIVIVGMYMQNELALALGIIWTAHIGMDRTIGYGLKYPCDFKSTHLQRV